MSELVVYLHVPEDSRIPIRLFLANDPDIPRQDPRLFKFELFRKPANFGDLAIDQFWMKPATIYGTESNSLNHFSLIDCFWSLYLRARDAREDDLNVDATVKTCILACLLPEMRKNGSKSIFKDQRPRKNWEKSIASEDSTKAQHGMDLNTMLKCSMLKKMSMYKFYNSTKALLGRPEYGNEVGDTYDVFTQYLFGNACEHFRRAPLECLNAIIKKWRDKMNRVGRRSGKETEKTVLDIFSYEARAAVHRCYAFVWDVLLPLLKEKFSLSDESEMFNRLWHFDHMIEATKVTDRYHLFHGHVFALHPATTLFVSTETGRLLVAQAIKASPSDQTSGTAFRRFLQGYCVAVCEYENHISTVADQRKIQPTLRSTEQITYEDDNRVVNLFKQLHLNSRVD